MCKCKDCQNYDIKSEITGYCSLKKYNVVANATCLDAIQKKTDNKQFDAIKEVFKKAGINL